MSKWTEIRNSFVNEEEKVVCIDAWKTNSPNEEGRVIAKVHIDTKEIEYLNEQAKTDEYAQEVIQNTIKML